MLIMLLEKFNDLNMFNYASFFFFKLVIPMTILWILWYVDHQHNVEYFSVK